jgi:hypothetical protein
LSFHLRLCHLIVLPFRFSNKYFICIFHFPHARDMPHPSHPPLFDHPHNIWWRVQMMELIIMQFSAASNHFIPLTSKYYPRNLVLRHPPSFNVRDQLSHPYKTINSLLIQRPLVCQDGVGCVGRKKVSIACKTIVSLVNIAYSELQVLLLQQPFLHIFSRF